MTGHANTNDAGTQRCAVCSLDAARPQLTPCDECGRWFHLGTWADDRSTNCGAPLIGSACGVSVACDRCIECLEREADAAGVRPARVRAA